MARPEAANLSSLAETLREYRQAARWTQRQLADTAAVSIRLVQNLEQGVCTRPRDGALQRLTAALGITAEDLASLSAGHSPAGPTPAGGRTVRVEVLGPLRVWLEATQVAVGGNRCRTVLALLAMNPGRVTSLGELTDALWDGAPPPTAATMVQAQVSRLRAALGDSAPREGPEGVLKTVGNGYHLDLERVGLDLLDFRGHARQTHEALRRRDMARACDAAEAALALWRGEPGADVALLWGHPAVTGLAQEHVRLVLAYADAAFPLGRHDQVLSALSSLVDAYPLDERAHAALMVALAGTGQQATALEVFDRVRRRLEEELGVRPGQALTEAHSRVLRQDVPLGARGHVAATLTHAPASSDPAPAEPLAPTKRTPCQLPSPVADFTGRTAELARLRGWLTPAPGSDSLPVAVVSGLPGVGKTTLALQVAHHMRGHFPDGHLWASLDGASPRPQDPYDLLGEWLRALGEPGQSIPEGDRERAALFRSRVADRRILVVADDAASAEQVAPLLPGSSGCAVLVTSRRQLRDLAGARTLPLGPLPADHAQELLGRITGTQRLAAEPAAAAALVDACERLPLAVRILGARLAARPSLPLQGLAADLLAGTSPPAGPGPGPADGTGVPGALAAGLAPAGQRLDVLSTGTLSVRASIASGYAALSPGARRAFTLLGLLGACDVAEWVVAALLGGQADGVADELTDRSMLTVAGADETGQARYRLHDLLREYAIEQAAHVPGPERCAALLRALDGWLQLATMACGRVRATTVFRRRTQRATPQVVPPITAERLTARPLAWFHAERQNLLTIIEQCAAAGRHQFAADIAQCLAGPLDLEFRADDAARSWRAVTTAAEAAGDTATAAWARLELATAVADTGSAAAGLQLVRQCVTAFEDHHDDAGLAFALQAVSELEARLEHRDAARVAADQAVSIARKAGNRHAELASLCTLGIALTGQGDYDGGVAACEQAVRIAEDMGQAYVRHALPYLTHTCVHASRYERAIALCAQRRVAARSSGDIADVAATWLLEGDACYGLGRYLDAIEAYSQALPLFRSVRCCYAMCFYKLGCAHHALGRYDDAIRYLETCRTMNRDLGLPGPEKRAVSALRACREPAASPGRLPISATRHRTA